MNTTAPARGISPVLVIFLITGLLGMLAAAVMLLSEGRNEPPTRLSTAVQPVGAGEWLADDFTLTSLDGEPVSLSDFAGRTVFLNFWRTDCAPCVREMPAFQSFAEAQGDDGAVVLAVNQGEDAESIRTFLQEINVSGIPVLLDEDLEMESDYPIQVLPTTYIINPSGYVAYTKYGEFDVEGMNVYLEAAESAAQNNSRG